MASTTPSHAKADSLRMRLFLLLCFTGIACIALANAILHVTTHLTLDPLHSVTDFYHFHWNFWWVRYALANQLNIYETTYVLAPWVNSLALHTLSLAWFPIWAVVEPFARLFGFSPAVSSNIAMTVIFIVALVLNGFVTYLFLRTFGVNRNLAFLGGVLIETAPLLLHSIGWTNLNLLGWFWPLLLILAWRRLVLAWQVHQPKLRPLGWIIILALGVWLMMLTDVQYAIFGVFLLVPYGVCSLVTLKTKTLIPRLVGSLGVALIVAVGLLTFLGPLDEIVAYSTEGIATTPAERGPKIEFPECFVWHCDRDVSMGALVLPGMILAVGLNVWMRKKPDVQHKLRKDRWFWLWVALPPLILSAGAYITIGGGTDIPMPYVALHQLLGGMFRYPERFSVVFMIPALVFIGATLTPLIENLRPSRQLLVYAGLFFVVVMDSRMFSPFPIQPLPTEYAFYEHIAHEPYEYVIVDIPTGGSSGEGFVGEPITYTTQFYALTHEKRVVNGHISRINTWHYMYMRTSDPMMAWLGQRRDLEADVVAEQMAERNSLFPIGYYVIHTQWLPPFSETLEEILGFLNSHSELACPYWQEGDLIAYRSVWHPEGCPPRTVPLNAEGLAVIPIGDAGDYAYLGTGWYAPEQIFDITLRWMGGSTETTLVAQVPENTQALILRAQSFAEPRDIRLLINGISTGQTLTITPEALENYRFEIPTGMLSAEASSVFTFVYAEPTRGSGDDDRALAFFVDEVAFE